MEIVFAENHKFESNILTLAFSGDLEKEYQDSQIKNTLRHVRIGLLLAILIYGIFGILDHWIVPEVEEKLWFIRFALFCPYVLAVYFFTFSKRFARYMQIMISSVVLFAGIGIIAMILMAPFPGNYSYYAGLILVFLYGYTFFRLRFIYATLAGWTIVIAYEFAATVLTTTPIQILINNNFFFLCGNFIGMIAGYSIEYYTRRDFLHTRLLTEEKQKVEDARRHLENRVEERTRQVVTVNEELVQRIAEQKRTEESLLKKVNFEQLLTTISTQFIHLRSDEVESGMQSAIRSISKFAGVDHGFMYLLENAGKPEKAQVQLFYEWFDESIESKGSFQDPFLIWLTDCLKEKKTINFSDHAKIDRECAHGKKLAQQEGVNSFLATQLSFGDRFSGFIGFDSRSTCITWSDEIISALKIVGDMLILANDRRFKETLLKQSEERYRTLFEKSSDVVFISSPDGKFIDINPAGVELFGFESKEDILHVNIAKDLYVNPEDREKFRGLIDRQGQIKDFEVKLHSKGGAEIIALESTTVLREKNGEILAYQGIIRDITKKRKMEQQLFQSQKMESIGLLAGGIAHDFNNILTALRGYSDMALMKTSADAPDQGELNGIRRGLERAENLTRQLLAFSRKQIIETKVIKINEVILNLEKMLRRLIGEDINLKTVLSDQIDQIKADPGQIEQILVNLVINARDAINQKNGQTMDRKITVETRQVYLDFSYVVNHPEVMVGDYLQISVSDTGAGMTDHVIDKIFEPFYTTKEHGKGTGLGLSTVYGIVKQNHGNIYVYSEVNKGTTIKIYWPTTDLEIISDYCDEADEELNSGEETILFVEDDFEVRNFMGEALKSLKYNIVEASNGVEALDLIKQRHDLKIDLLITDVIMPEMGGKELAEEIVKIVPGIKILFTSGYTDNHIVRSGRLDNGINFLQKPFTIKDISKKIRNIVEN